MKNNIILAAIISLFTLPVFAQQKMTAEEMAIKKVIENETMYYNQRNYEKWAECVAQDPMSYFTWTSPFAGENAVFEAKGWKEISKKYKEDMAKWPPSDDQPVKENYQFKINGNMAYVTFLESGGSESVRVMEKKDGQWRILRMEALATESFKKMHELYTLQRMAGHWKVDMSTFKKEGGGNWTMQNMIMDIEKTPTGILILQHSKSVNKEGTVGSSEGSMVASYNMKTGKIGSLNSVHIPYSNWTIAYAAEGSIDEQGRFVAKGHEVGGDSHSEFSFWRADNMLHWDLKVMDKDGKQVMANSYSMRPVDAASAQP